MRKARQAKVVRNMAQNSFFFRSGMAILLALLANSAAQTNAQTVATEESVNVNGVTRTYLLYIPWKYEPGESALIIALHGRGGGGPGSVMEQYSDLNEKADRTGFAVAYLNGLPDATGTVNWNYYYDPFFSNAPDDIGSCAKSLIRCEQRFILTAGAFTLRGRLRVDSWLNGLEWNSPTGWRQSAWWKAGFLSSHRAARRWCPTQARRFPSSS